ncbi:MmcQ/YjbR family DNA-binding protein [Bacteroides sp. 214]|uniref:MmcQ/YjbR family DNA-binding protein n=1 Tax=Bacteroides sp. 214 TaxID=2302935 RepID=UPI0013D34F9D|nr:MmcQ/YjbR family DNA-binding protein [Bacteroides sp. 214]NDW12643.1 MmcQ/YjbR family DNA-binding protein [Bacteroides sp. 214]
MNIEELRDYCLSLKEAVEYMPFEDEYLIFKIFDKWFAIIPLNDPVLKITVKCDPSEAIDLRERYHSVEPAWHFNKKFWNSITLNGDMNDETVKHWIRHSIKEVLKKLPKRIQSEYLENNPLSLE